MNGIPNMLARADEAVQQGQWDLARRLYQEVLAAAPGHPEAERGLHRVSQREAVDGQVQDLIAAADASFQSGAYTQALQTYIRAINQAAQVGILYYHAKLEQQQRVAQELLAWQQRTSQALAAAEKRKAQADWDGAYTQLGQTLAEMPQEELFKPMAEPLEKARHEAARAMDDGAKFQMAREAFLGKDFEEAIRLAKEISANSTLGGDVAKLVQNAEHHLHHFIEPHLQVAEAAFQAQRWEDAFAALERLRGDYPGSPVWQRHWLEVGMAHGHQALDLGRQANTQRAFSAARTQFEAARGAFEKVLEVYPKHGWAPALLAEARDLSEVAVVEVQAQARWAASDRGVAAAGLDNALSLIAHAKAEGRDYTSIAAVVGAMRQALAQEMERIQEEERRLRDGQRLLGEKRLDEAQDRFRKTLDALLPDTRQAAAEGLREAETEQRLFEEEVRHGQPLLADQPAAAAAFWRSAYERWPHGPQIRVLLVDALVRAAEAVVSADPNTAADFCGQAGQLDPDNRRVKQLERYVGVKPAVEAVLRQAQSELDGLAKKPEAPADLFMDIGRRLEGALVKAEEFPDLKARLQQLLQAAHAGQAQRRAMEQQRQATEQARAAGEWDKAVELLRQAAAAAAPGLAAGAQDEVTKALEAAQSAAQAVQAARPAAKATLERAQAAYAEAAATRDFQPALAALDQVEQAVQRAREAAQDANGRLPEDLNRLSQLAGELRQRVVEVREALVEKTPGAGLTRLRALRQQGRPDPTLEALVTALEARGREAVPELKQQAQAAQEEGRLVEAVELLRQAQELQPEDTDLKTQYAAVVRRKKLTDAVRLAQADAAAKLASGGGGKVEAVKALRGALDLLLEADLPPDARTTLQQLFSLAEKSDNFAFGLPEQWLEAQVLKDSLTALASEQANWALRPIAELANDWATVKRDVALLGVVASSKGLDELDKAYSAAETYLRLHPTDVEAIAQEAEQREALVAKLISSVRKRLNRASDAIQRGQFPLALENLRSLETEIYGPVAAGHPDLLSRFDAIEQTLKETAALQAQAERLQALHARAAPRLDAADQFFVTNKFAEAEAELEALPDLAGAAELEQRRVGLRAGILRARQARAGRAFNDVMAGMEVRLRTATTPDHYETLLHELAGLPNQIDQTLLSHDEHERFRRAKDQAREQHENHKAGSEREIAAANAEQGHDYLRAVSALEGALAMVRDGRRRVELEQRLEALRPVALRQQQRNEAQERGQRHFTAREYDAAARELSTAQSLGATVDDLLLAARVGVFLANAHRYYEQKDWEGAQLELDDARSTAGADAQQREAVDVLKEVGRLQQRLTLKLEQLQRAEEKQELKDMERQERDRAVQAEMQEHLSAGTSALALGDLDTAARSALAILKLVPRQAEALELQKQVNLHRQAGVKLQQALAARDTGQFGKALLAVQAALKLLPDNPEAGALQQELQDQATLAQAENLAHSGEFQRAREALRAAANHGIDQLLLFRTQERIQEMERAWKDGVLQPIRDDMRDSKYSEAILKAQAALSRAASAEVQAELNVLLTTSVNQLAQGQLSALRRQLGSPGQEAEVLAELERLTALDPRPAPNLVNEINSLRRQTHEQTLRARLQAAKEQATQGDRPGALIIIQAIAQEATAQGSPTLYELANALGEQIETQLDEEQERHDHARRSQLIEQASAALQQAVDRRGLVQARDLSADLLKMPRFAADAEGTSLADQAGAALALLDATQAAIKNSRDHLRRRRVTEAEAALRLGEVSPLRKVDFDQQHEIVRLLRTAEIGQDEKRWEFALAALRAALALDRSLENLYARDLKRCRDELVRAVFSEVEQRLLAHPPEPGAAQTLLDRAERENWIGPDDKDRFLGLQGWVVSRAKAVQAVAWLDDPQGDPAAALAGLNEARQRLPHGQSADDIGHYEQLAHAIAALRLGQLDIVAVALSKLPADFLKRPRVVQVAAALKLATVEAERRQALADQLDQARREAEQALNVEPPRYEAAVTAVQNARMLAGADDERVATLAEVIQERIGAALEGARLAGRFDEARAIGSRLLLLPPDERLRRIIEGLPAERTARLNAAFLEVSQHLAADQLAPAAQALQRAETIAGTEGDSRLGDLRARLREREMVVDQVTRQLQAARAALARSEWEAMIAALERARQLAPEYQSVTEAVAEAQDRLVELAQPEQQAGRYAQALSWCALARRLGARPDLEALERSTTAARDQRLNELLAQTRRYQQEWRLDAAAGALAEARAVRSDDLESRRLAEGLERMVEFGHLVGPHLEAGWQALQARHYSEARIAFAAAVELIPAAMPRFREADQWISYTDNMEAALRAVETGSYEAAAKFLEAAAMAFQIDDADTLPTIGLAPDTLALQRRQAVYDAERLRDPAAELQRLSAESRKQELAGNFEGALSLAAQLIDQNKPAFFSLHQTHSRPPHDSPLQNRPPRLPVPPAPVEMVSRPKATTLSQPASPLTASGPADLAPGRSDVPGPKPEPRQASQVSAPAQATLPGGRTPEAPATEPTRLPPPAREADSPPHAAPPRPAERPAPRAPSVARPEARPATPTGHPLAPTADSPAQAIANDDPAETMPNSHPSVSASRERPLIRDSGAGRPAEPLATPKPDALARPDTRRPTPTADGREPPPAEKKDAPPSTPDYTALMGGYSAAPLPPDDNSKS